MSINQYIAEYIDPQIKWHDSKSCLNKWGYLICSIFSIVGSIVSAVVIPYSQLCGSISSAIVAIAVGMNSLFKFQTKWRLYRTTAESLCLEKIHYQVGIGRYNCSNKEDVFIDSTMEILKTTNIDWQNIFCEEQSSNE